MKWRHQPLAKPGPGWSRGGNMIFANGFDFQERDTNNQAGLGLKHASQGYCLIGDQYDAEHSRGRCWM